MDDELLDVVDEQDQPIGTVNRADYAAFLKNQKGYLRAIDMFIVNREGKIFTPTRTANKTIAPNGLDYSVGGHVSAGEGYMETLIRETEEELNMHITEQDVEFIGKILTPYNRYVRCVYLVRSDRTPDFNKDDFKAAEWLTSGEILEKINEGHPAKDSLALTVGLLQAHLLAR